MALDLAHQGQLETALQLLKQAIAQNDDPSLHEKLTSDRIITEFLIGTKAQYRRSQISKRILFLIVTLLIIGLWAVTYRSMQHYFRQNRTHSSMPNTQKLLEKSITPPSPLPLPTVPSPTPLPTPSPKYQTITGLSAPLVFPEVKPKVTSKKRIPKRHKSTRHGRRHLRN